MRQEHSLVFCHQRSEAAKEKSCAEKREMTLKGVMVTDRERKNKYKKKLQILFLWFVLCSFLRLNCYIQVADQNPTHVTCRQQLYYREEAEHIYWTWTGLESNPTTNIPLLSDL